MRAANDRPGSREDAHSHDDIDLEPAAKSTADSGDAGWGDGVVTAQLRSRLAAVAGFLTLFHLVFALVKATGPVTGSASTSDTPAWSLMLRAAAAGLVFAILWSPLRLNRRQVRFAEVCLFGFEMLIMLASQYLSAIDLIDRRDFVDAVAVQKNGVIRTLMLMICC